MLVFKKHGENPSHTHQLDDALSAEEMRGHFFIDGDRSSECHSFELPQISFTQKSDWKPALNNRYI